jgi:Cys-tRNA(Pro)/Cys-tRNA(Cys) deacylase
MTPAIRFLEQAGVAFQLHRYEHDAAADSFGLEAAAKLGVPPDRVFKTLVAQIDGDSLEMAILPSDSRLDLKKLAAAADGKKAELADPKLAEKATGYVIGGISPLAVRKPLPTYLDETAILHETIYVSAGQRGLQMELSPDLLLRVAEATLVDLVKS